MINLLLSKIQNSESLSFNKPLKPHKDLSEQTCKMLRININMIVRGYGWNTNLITDNLFSYRKQRIYFNLKIQLIIKKWKLLSLEHHFMYQEVLLMINEKTNCG